MRLQRWPDGSQEWTLFVWSRHPEWSRTWTHGCSISQERKGAWDGPRKWALFSTKKTSAGRTFYARIGRITFRWERQPPAPRAETRMNDDRHD